MQAFIKKFVPIISVFTLAIFLVSPSVSNAKQVDSKSYTEKDVEDLAEILEFMYEDAIITSENGEFKSLDYEKIQKNTVIILKWIN